MYVYSRPKVSISTYTLFEVTLWNFRQLPFHVISVDQKRLNILGEVRQWPKSCCLF